jgi:hypothetical protein
MKFLIISATPRSATHQREDGSYVTVLPAAKVTTLQPLQEAESLESLVQTEKLTAYQRPAPVSPPTPRVPAAIENWRAKAVLSIAGLLPAVEAALQAMPEPGRTVALAAWTGGAEIHRQGPTVAAAIAALQLDAAQVDAMFIQAAALEV